MKIEPLSDGRQGEVSTNLYEGRTLVRLFCELPGRAPYESITIWSGNNMSNSNMDFKPLIQFEVSRNRLGIEDRAYLLGLGTNFRIV